jgi:hypothetical protein
LSGSKERELEMPYEPDKDQLLASWENDGTGLMISIYRYGDGEPKLQIGPRSYTKRDGTKSTTKSGRLRIDDVVWLSQVIEEVQLKMNQYFLEEDQAALAESPAPSEGVKGRSPKS